MSATEQTYRTLFQEYEAAGGFTIQDEHLFHSWLRRLAVAWNDVLIARNQAKRNADGSVTITSTGGRFTAEGEIVE